MRNGGWQTRVGHGVGGKVLGVLGLAQIGAQVARVGKLFREPELRDRVKDLLNPGARLEIATADFDTSEQFMTVAHAARNTKVPFMVLKDRVLNQGQSLAEAIGEIKPELDAKAEVTRARAAARSDLEIAG